MTKIGIAFGGGGVRSLAAIGVLRELTRLGVPVHAVAGTSAGAVVGAFYAAGIPVAAMEQAARQFRWHDLFEPPLLVGRPISGQRLMRFIGRYLGERATFEGLALPLAVTAVDITQGRLVVFDKGPLLPALRASLALPGIIRPVPQADGSILVDGGVLGAVPAHVLRAAGCDVVIAVDVRSEEPGEFRPLARTRGRELFLRVGEVMSIYITDRALEQADIVIRPDVRGIGSFDVKRAAACIAAGAAAARARAPELATLARTLPPAPVRA